MRVKSDQMKKSGRRQWFTREPAVPDSKRRYREKRLEYIALWLLPLIPVGYTLLSQGVSMPWLTLVGMLLPVMVGSGAALVFASHALWRIEVNMSGNREHPFTEKDHQVLGRSTWILLASLLFALAVNSVAHMVAGGGVSDAQLRFIRTAANTAFIVAFVGAALTSTMKRIHCKAKRAYEELEKGV